MSDGPENRKRSRRSSTGRTGGIQRAPQTSDSRRRPPKIDFTAATFDAQHLRTPVPPIVVQEEFSLEPPKPKRAISHGLRNGSARSRLDAFLRASQSQHTEEVQFELPDLTFGAHAGLEAMYGKHASASAVERVSPGKLDRVTMESRAERSTSGITLTRDTLDDCVLIGSGQLDKKFILVRARDVIVAIDQHAADERIALEQLQNDLLNESQRLRKVSNFRLREPVSIPISSGQLAVAIEHSELLRSWGWRFKIHEDDHPAAQISTVPRLLGEVLGAPHFKDFLSHFRAGTGTIPRCIQTLIASRACRMAIKFGDVLDDDDCIQMIKNLKDCKFPFQCAHGRPSMVPLFTVQKDENKVLEPKCPDTPPNISSLRKVLQKL